MSALDAVRGALEGRPAVQTSAADEIAPPPALETLCKLFGLSPFERAVLLMCAGVELDSKFAGVCTAGPMGIRAKRIQLSASRSLRVPDSHWSALAPDAVLRRWHLIEVPGAGEVFTTSPLRIDERILHYLTGVAGTDERLHGLIEPAIRRASSHRLIPSSRKKSRNCGAVRRAPAVGQSCSFADVPEPTNYPSSPQPRGCRDRPAQDPSPRCSACRARTWNPGAPVGTWRRF